MTTTTLTLADFLLARISEDEAAARAARRFVAKVEVDESGCWLWTSGLNRNGYGRFMHPATKRGCMAHRWAYEVSVGPIPPGLDLDHLCRVRRCVNPDHLEPVTRRENLLRGETTVARAANATHCPSGHPYSDGNVYINPKGHRRCRTCHRQRQEAMRKTDPEYLAKHRAHDAAYRARLREERGPVMSRAVSARHGVPCPTCGAAPDDPCRALTTGRVTDTHLARITR